MPYHLTSGDRYLSIEEDEFWKEEWGAEFEVFEPFCEGRSIDAKYLPSSGYFENRRKTYPPFVMIPYLMCNEEVKTIIEQYEPGKHNFFPFEIRNSKKGEVVAIYYIINVVSDVSAIDAERSDPELVKLFPRQDGETEEAYINGSYLIAVMDGRVKGSAGIVLKPEAYLSSHLWVDKLTPTSEDYFLSDELYEAAKPYISKSYFLINQTK